VSQFGEDVWLYNNLFHEKRNGFYLEMGAMDGMDISNTRWFKEAAGWRGLLIEACPGVKNGRCGDDVGAVRCAVGIPLPCARARARHACQRSLPQPHMQLLLTTPYALIPPCLPGMYQDLAQQRRDSICVHAAVCADFRCGQD
jgi:hypothetical protein